MTRAKTLVTICQIEWSRSLEYAPNTENEIHHHEFTADAIVIEGEFWLTTEGKTQHLYPGDSFHIPSMVKHKEKYGPEGCVFWVARI